MNGDDVAEGSDITLTHGEEDIDVEGGCMGFYIVHELEEDRIRVVKPGLHVGRLDCGKPEEVQRQAESILGVMRNLDQVWATQDRFELRTESGEVAAFVPPAPAQVHPALAGTEWLLTSLKGEELLTKTEVSLEIDSEMLGGDSGCNFYGSEVDKMDEDRSCGPGDTAAGWAAQTSAVRPTSCARKPVIRTPSAMFGSIGSRAVVWR